MRTAHQYTEPLSGLTPDERQILYCALAGFLGALIGVFVAVAVLP